MIVNYYYSLRNLNDTTATNEDDELLQVCRPCAQKYADQMQWASRGDEENECEFCGEANDPQRKASLDALFAAARSGK